MHHCTYNKQPKYWDDAIDDLRIIHFSSSPKPWEISTDNNSRDEAKEHTSYLSSNEECSLQLAKSGKLERMWHDAYKQSQRYHEEELQKQSALKRRRVPDQRKSASTASFRSTTPRSSAPPPSRLQQQQNPHSMAQRRYKELRKAGMDMKQAMLASRTEYGLDKADNRDAGKAVGQMFGLAWDLPKLKWEGRKKCLISCVCRLRLCSSSDELAGWMSCNSTLQVHFSSFIGKMRLLIQIIHCMIRYSLLSRCHWSLSWGRYGRWMLSMMDMEHGGVLRRRVSLIVQNSTWLSICPSTVMDIDDADSDPLRSQIMNNDGLATPP